MQLRILTVVASRTGTTLSELAAATGLHLSRASRACDRLVDQDLLDRQDDPDDRRSLRLTLTDQGHQVVAQVAEARRNAVTPALRRMPAGDRRVLVDALTRFTDAGDEPAHTELWALGWTTGPDADQN